MANIKETLTKGLISLKKKKEEKKEVPIAYEESPYPYGTRLSLQKEQLEDLGIDVAKLSVGNEVLIVGKATIDTIRQSDSKNSESKELCLQITDLKIDEE